MRYVTVNPIRVSMPPNAPKEFDYFITDEQASVLDSRDKRTQAMVVVEFPNAGMTLCYVAVLGEAGQHSEKATKWIVDVVDDRAYRKRKIDEKRRQEIIKELSVRQEKLEAAERFKKIAENDSEAAKLLEELKNLSI